MKGYTNLEQSRKLAGILSPESADMCYVNDGTTIKIDANPYTVRYSMWKDCVTEIIPCWSLAALLGAVDFITINLFYIDEKGYWVVSATIHNSTKLCTKYESAMAFNPVDACYELISYSTKLKELAQKEIPLPLHGKK